MKDGIENYITVSQFAHEAKITPQAIRKAIKEKRINAEKIGSQYVIEISELVRFLEE